MTDEKEVKKGLSNSWKDYFQLGEVAGYFFRKKDPSRPSNFNIRMMHGINRISIIMFLIHDFMVFFCFIKSKMITFGGYRSFRVRGKLAH